MAERENDKCYETSNCHRRLSVSLFPLDHHYRRLSKFLTPVSPSPSSASSSVGEKMKGETEKREESPQEEDPRKNSIDVFCRQPMMSLDRRVGVSSLGYAFHLFCQKIYPRGSNPKGQTLCRYDVIALRPSRSRQFVSARIRPPLLPLPIQNNPFSLRAFSRAPATDPLIFPEAAFPALVWMK